MKAKVNATLFLGAVAAPLVALVMVAGGGGSILDTQLVASHKPSGGGSTAGSYSVTVSPAAPYSFGESISVTTNAPLYPNNARPWIGLTCTQNGTTVLTGSHAGFSGGWYYNWPFKLGPTNSWSGGSANCTVTVWHQSSRKQVTDASTSFFVNG